ncbi:hypothetical protein [Candidatus Igneacidithiobacillus taiwanensis]|uniref:hypothetical protein n=1 Tax=Candidatus Igneacidithiobacillus taiwanensis TaxID=1945924 RepID=UPI00289C89C9|nr:hypothetical protein [Candidatus Igneacidithiobacillus taiwanensis]
MANEQRSAMEHALQSVPASQVAKLAALARQHDIGEDDPLWLFVLAAQVNLGLLEASLEHSKTTQDAVEKVPSMLLRSVQQAERDVLSLFKQRSVTLAAEIAHQTDEAVSKTNERLIELWANQIASVNQYTENALAHMNKALLTQQDLMKTVVKRIQNDVIDQVKERTYETVTETANKIFKTKVDDNRALWSIIGGAIALALIVVGGLLTYLWLDSVDHVIAPNTIASCHIEPSGAEYCWIQK